MVHHLRKRVFFYGNAGEEGAEGDAGLYDENDV